MGYIYRIIMNGAIKVGGWTGWGSGAKRNGGDPPHCTVTVYWLQFYKLSVGHRYFCNKHYIHVF
jgi:hypothetical protein